MAECSPETKVLKSFLVTASEISNLPITSFGNQKYKEWRKIVKDPSPAEVPWLPVEGKKQIRELALKMSPELLLVSDGIKTAEIEDLATQSGLVVKISDQLMQGLSSVENSQGLLAFFKKPAWRLGDLTSTVICLDGIQDPGNLGTIIRTAAAMGDFSIACRENTVSPFNSKVVRSSAGYLFRVPVIQDLSPAKLRELGYHLWYSFPGEGTELPDARFSFPAAIIMGSEGSGIAMEAIPEGALRLTIPMPGELDSLNVAVAASIIMYEISRKKAGGV